MEIKKPLCTSYFVVTEIVENPYKLHLLIKSACGPYSFEELMGVLLLSEENIFFSYSDKFDKIFWKYKFKFKIHFIQQQLQCLHESKSKLKVHHLKGYKRLSWNTWLNIQTSAYTWSYSCQDLGNITASHIIFWLSTLLFEGGAQSLL